MRNKDPILSVVILNFNTRDLLVNCLKSVIESEGFDNCELEVIVVDNASIDKSVDAISEIINCNSDIRFKVIRNKKNIGFSAGNNIGIKVAGGKYVLLLNSDTKVERYTLRLMTDFMEKDDQIGAATCKLVLGNGKLDPASHRGFPTPWNAFFYLMLPMEKIFPKSKMFGGYHQGWKDYLVPHEVDAISGAFFMISRKVIKKVGLLDENFFMYGEDLDWCYRIKKAGYKIMFNPQTVTVHYKKQSGRSQKYDKNLRKSVHYSFIDTMAQFYMKHYKDKYPKLVTWLVKLGIVVKKVI